MFNTPWLTDIFSATSDQARLVTVVISALIAVTVVLLNQVLTNRRENRAFLASKVEELYIAAHALDLAIMDASKLYFEESHCSDGIFNRTPPEIAEDFKKKITQHRNEIKTNFQKIIMLKNLYFDAIEFSPSLLEVHEAHAVFSVYPFKNVIDQENHMAAVEVLVSFGGHITDWCTKRTHKTQWHTNLYDSRNAIIVILAVAFIVV